MTVYAMVVFVHVVGALGLFTGLGIEWLSVDRLSRARTLDEVVEWTTRLTSLRRLLGPSMGLLLASGIYLVASVWGHVWWAAAGLLGMVLMGVVDAAVARGWATSVSRALRNPTASATPEILEQLRSPRLRASIELRLAIALGIVFVMSAKPGLFGSLATVSGALLLGAVVRAPVWRRLRVTSSDLAAEG